MSLRRNASLAPLLLALATPAALARTVSFGNDWAGRPYPFTATTPDAANIAVSFAGTWGDTLLLDIVASVTDTATPLTIDFDRTTSPTTWSVGIRSIRLTNSTGAPWTGLQGALTGPAGLSLTLDRPSASSFSLSPFTSFVFDRPGGTHFTLSGGTLPAGDTLSLGSTRGGGLPVASLTLVGSPNADAFSLSLTPLPATTPIPLPSAATAALSTLLPLAALSFIKSHRRHP